VNKSLEEARQRGEIGKSLEAAIELSPADEATWSLCERYRGTLAELFIVSEVRLTQPAEGKPPIAVAPATGEKCSRCWTITSAPVAAGSGVLCGRCARVVGAR